MAYQHNKAYCLMWYCCVCGHEERIWNSRDGAVALILTCPSCGGLSLQHEPCLVVACSPEHKLNLYQRYWRDGTEEEARAVLVSQWEYLQEICPDLIQEYPDRESYIRSCLDHPLSVFRPGWPMLDICKEA